MNVLEYYRICLLLVFLKEEMYLEEEILNAVAEAEIQANQENDDVSE